MINVTEVIFRTVLIVVAFVLLFLFPIGTIFSLIIFWWLWSSAKKSEENFDENQIIRERQYKEHRVKRKNKIRDEFLKTEYGQLAQQAEYEEEKREFETQRRKRRTLEELKSKLYSEHSNIIDFLSFEKNKLAQISFIDCEEKYVDEITIVSFKIKYEFTIFKAGFEPNRGFFRITIDETGQVATDQLFLGNLDINLPDLKTEKFGLVEKKLLKNILIKVVSAFEKGL
jgi:hypothetical protein